jgi:hypothetical protein
MSDMFLLDSNAVAASIPTTYLKSGLSEVTASRITFATSDGCVKFCAHCLKYSDILLCIDVYGDLKEGSEIFEVHFKFFKKFEPTPPGSMTMILIPNGSSSYRIDLDRPSRANLVAWYRSENYALPNSKKLCS